MKELSATPTNFGIEIDIRSHGERLVVQHDPFKDGEDFQEWAETYQHGTLILNVKEEGLEDKIINILDMYKIHNFFFLDQSFPYLVKTFLRGEKRCAVRISEFESPRTALNLIGKVDWIWYDSFYPIVALPSEMTALKKAFKICLVSPELQGRNDTEEIKRIINVCQQQNIAFDAVCTKNPDFWSPYVR